MRVGIDTGGTFTDLVAFDPVTRELLFHKVSSTPSNPHEGILRGIAELMQPVDASPEAIELLVHGTTVATNAVLQRRGAKVAFITTAGFRDVLHIQRQDRPRMYDLRSRRPAPLVPREHRYELQERMLFDGTVRTPVGVLQLQHVIDELRAAQITAVAVGLLHSYANPAHEREVGAALAAQLPGVAVCLSHELVGELGEYERFSTAAMNAFVQPVVGRYLQQLEAGLRQRGIAAPLFVMKSNGGVMAAAAAAGSLVELEDAGAAAVVLHSLFEEQIRDEGDQFDHFLSFGNESYAEALSYLPTSSHYRGGPHEYLELIRAAKERLGIPVVGSLNGVTAGGWIEFARQIEQAGVDALELNIYYLSTSTEKPGAQVDAEYLDLVAQVRAEVSIPMAVKVSPFFSATAHMAKHLALAGAAGLVLFNRFYQPDFDLDSLTAQSRLHLSASSDLNLPLRWTALLYGRVAADLAITGGIHSHQDLLKGVMAGAAVTMTASALLKHGAGHIQIILAGVRDWMDEHEYESVAQMHGSMSQQHLADSGQLERANYVKLLQTWRPDPTGNPSHRFGQAN